MDSIRTYLLTLFALAVILSIIHTVAKGMPKTSATIKLLCGLIFVITAFSPLLNIPEINLKKHFATLSEDAQSLIADGKSMADMEMERIIKAQAESYIQNKAKSIGAEIDVSVILSEDQNKIPISAEITGNVSPYYKNRLKQIIAVDVGIPEEAQIWK